MKKLKNYLDNINLNYKKEVTIYIVTIIISMFLTGLFIYLEYPTLSILAIMIPIALFFVKMWQYSSIKDNIIRQREDEFINVINYLEIFLSNKFNVYNAFLQVKSFCSAWMRDKIDELLEQIDKDKTVEPFVNFAKNFKKPIVENVMVSIFQMMEEGENANQLNQFDILFQRFSENHHMGKIDKKKHDIDSLSSFPLIGAAIVTLILTFGIMAIMSEVIDVI